MATSCGVPSVPQFSVHLTDPDLTWLRGGWGAISHGYGNLFDFYRQAATSHLCFHHAFVSLTCKGNKKIPKIFKYHSSTEQFLHRRKFSVRNLKGMGNRIVCGGAPQLLSSNRGFRQKKYWDLI